MAAKKSNANATQRSLKLLRDDPRFTLVDVAEKFIAFPPPGHRSDLFGVIDIVAIGPGITMGVQATTVGSFSAHKKKLREHPSSPLVLEAGWLLEIWAWEKVNNRWTHRTHKFELEHPTTEGDA